MDSMVTMTFNGVGLVFYGIGLLIAVRLLRRDPYSQEEGILESAMSVGGCVMIVGGIVALSIGTFAAFAVVLLLAGIFAIFCLRSEKRTGQQYALLWMLVAAAERLAPLAPVFASFAREQGGRFSRKAHRMAKLLERGETLPDALRQCNGLLPNEVTPILRVGYESGSLAVALRKAAEVHESQDTLRDTLKRRELHTMLVLIMSVGLMTFGISKIIPQLIMLMDDREMEFTSITKVLIQIAYLIGNYGGVQLLFLLLLAYILFRWMGWELPGTRRFTRRFHVAAILDALALAADARRPFVDTLAGLSQTYPRRWVKTRLADVAKEVADGRPWAGSLAEHGLLDAPSLAVLQAAERVGNLPWALREMAESGRRRAVYRVETLMEILHPIGVLAFAAMVAFYVVAMFLPSIQLIREMEP